MTIFSYQREFKILVTVSFIDFNENEEMGYFFYENPWSHLDFCIKRVRKKIHKFGLVGCLSGEMFLLPSLMTGIESLGPIWWKERDGSS